MQQTLHLQIKEDEEETALLKKRITDLSTSNRHIDDLLTEVTEEVSTINNEDTTETGGPDTDSLTAADHGKISSDCTNMRKNSLRTGFNPTSQMFLTPIHTSWMYCPGL